MFKTATPYRLTLRRATVWPQDPKTDRELRARPPTAPAAAPKLSRSNTLFDLPLAA